MSTLFSINQDGIFIAYMNFNLNPVPFPLNKIFLQARCSMMEKKRKKTVATCNVHEHMRLLSPLFFGLVHEFGQLSKLLICFG